MADNGAIRAEAAATGTGVTRATVTHAVVVEAIVQEALPNSLFKVRLEGGQEVLAHVSQKLRLHFVRILPGDTVSLELSVHDPGRGRILRRR